MIRSAQHEARYRQPCLLSLPTQQTLLPMALAPARTAQHLQPSPKVRARQFLPPSHNLDLLLAMPIMLSMDEASSLLCSSSTQSLKLARSDDGDFRRRLAGLLLLVKFEWTGRGALLAAAAAPAGHWAAGDEPRGCRAPKRQPHLDSYASISTSGTPAPLATCGARHQRCLQDGPQAFAWSCQGWHSRFCVCPG